MKLLSHVRLFATPWTVAYKPPPPMRFSRQEYWSGLPFPSPGDLPNPGIEPRSPTLQADALPSEPPGDMRELQYIFLSYVNKDLIFLGHFSCHWMIAIDLPVQKNFFFPKGFQSGVWKLRVSTFHVSSSSLHQLSVHSNQTKPKLHQPGVELETKGKEMPGNQKPSGKSVPQKMIKWCPEIKSQMA